jgi:type II secretory pathway pseudopilin PulG
MSKIVISHRMTKLAILKSRRGAMKGIFISYRRQDSQSAAGRLADHLRDNMPEVPIFRDVETIEPGIDFVEAIGKALESCGILLAIIGPRWANMTDAAGHRRLDDANDYARLEIATALKRSDVRVIPVLVEGAEMPGAETLPDDLKALARRNAIELTDKRWEFDVSTLVDTLRKALGIEPKPKPLPPDPVPPLPKPASSGNWKKWAWGVGVLAVLGAIYNAEEGGQTVTPPEPVTAQYSVAGNWQDAEGGRYRIAQQGGQMIFQGTSIHGAVSGAGTVQDNQFSFSYALNGVPYQAVLLLSPDGLNLRGQYRSPSTGESGMVVLQRIQ